MVLQKLIQDGHLEVRESLIDMNNTVLKVRFWLKMFISVCTGITTALVQLHKAKSSYINFMVFGLFFISFLASLSHHVQ